MEILIAAVAVIAIGVLLVWLDRAPQLNRVLAEHERDEAARAAEQQDITDEGAA